MKNPQTGKYEIYKHFSSTGATVVGIGDTQDEARADYKVKLEAYRSQPLIPTGEYISSPGFAGVRYDDGRVRYQYNADRQAQVLGRKPTQGKGSV